MRILDAGCGTGALAVEAAQRGAEVVAVDLSPTLVGLARERSPRDLGIRFEVGDMLDPKLGHFDHVVAMDSLIHYRAPDVLRVLGILAERTGRSLLFTFAPRTPLLATMHAVGKMFPEAIARPRSSRSRRRRCCVLSQRNHQSSPGGRADGVPGFAPGRIHRVATGFYISQALELVRA